MSMISSIMEFIRGREAEAAPVDVPVSRPPVGADLGAPPTPPIREGYMPDNSNNNYVNKAWKDQVKSRSMKGLLKKAEETEDEKNARILQTARWTEAPSREDAVNDKDVKWTDAEKIKSMDARRRLEEGERKREEARLKAQKMRQP